MANELRQGRRAFRPTLDGGQLEERKLLAHSPAVRIQTAAGGQAVVVTTPDSSRYYVSVINNGTVRATPASNGRVNLIVTGSSVDTMLEINQITSNHSLKAAAHTFNPENGTPFSTLNVASIQVTSGVIGDIEGYRDAVLSGPITIAGTERVDRIAFDKILAGGSISVGGDLNTLDVLNDADFNASAGLFVGEDLNWAEIGGNLTFENGANLVIGRDLGLTAQAAKGTGLAGEGLFVNGNLTIGATSAAAIIRDVDFMIVVFGNAAGVSRLSVGGTNVTTPLVVRGTTSA